VDHRDAGHFEFYKMSAETQTSLETIALEAMHLLQAAATVAEMSRAKSRTARYKGRSERPKRIKASIQGQRMEGARRSARPNRCKWISYRHAVRT
jgi:hypothetical protein